MLLSFIHFFHPGNKYLEGEMDRHTTNPHRMTAQGSASLKVTLRRGIYLSAV